MAGSALVVETKQAASAHSPGLLDQITADIRNIVTDIEVLRAGLAVTEDWILEVNTDFETRISASEAYNAGNLVDAAGETTTTLTATGAALGDFVQIALEVDLVDMILIGYVQATNTVEGWLQNESTQTVNLASATLRYLVTPIAASMLSGVITAPVLSASAFDAAIDMLAFDITIS